MKFLHSIRGFKKTPADHNSNLIPASSGESMNQFIDWLKNYSSLRPRNVFEIGANLGQDAEAVRKGFKIKPENVWVFEPHPELNAYIKDHYSFNTFSYAVLNKDSNININLINLKKNTNSGISSVRVHKSIPESDFIKIRTRAVRMDTFIKEHKIKSIDFLKLDVEGCNYEVLQGFGDKLDIIKSIHIEAEHHESWRGEKLWKDIKDILEPHFEMVYFQRFYTQSDSFWVNPRYLSTHE